MERTPRTHGTTRYLSIKEQGSPPIARGWKEQATERTLLMGGKIGAGKTGGKKMQEAKIKDKGQPKRSNNKKAQTKDNMAQVTSKTLDAVLKQQTSFPSTTAARSTETNPGSPSHESGRKNTKSDEK